MEELEEYFNVEFLDKISKEEKIYYSSTCGIDKISSKKLYDQRKETLEFIYKKIIFNEYKLSPYKIKLIIKGTQKMPRTTCVPTSRDKIVIAAIKKYLYDIYKEFTINISANDIVRKITKIKNEKKYNSFIKLDISKFFDTIDQDLLLQMLNKKIKNESILKIIKNIITNPRKYADTDERKKVFEGIPQGISISALLANIYLKELDIEYGSKENINYFRYVDDILIFCNEKDIEEIKNKFIFKLKNKYSLSINNEKTKIGKIEEEFEFLGYKFIDNIISVRASSKIAFESSIENIFKNFSRIKEKNEREINKFIWILNTKITGIVSEKHRYGWLYYYSCIDDKKILFELDNLILKFFKRFKLDELIDINNIKSFNKAYYEIKYKYNTSNYLFKFNDVSYEEMIDFLETVCDFKIDKNGINGEEIERKFKYNFYKTLKSLEKDLDDISN